MKRMIFSGGIILIFASMVLMSFAAMTRDPVSTNNLPDLKGKWEGTRITGGGTSALTDLEIYNDTIPLQGKLLVHNVIVRGTQGRTVTLNFKNGVIDKEGNILIKSGDNVFELSLYRSEGKMKLEGDYYFMGFRGKVSFYKK